MQTQNFPRLTHLWILLQFVVVALFVWCFDLVFVVGLFGFRLFGFLHFKSSGDIVPGARGGQEWPKVRPNVQAPQGLHITCKCSSVPNQCLNKSLCFLLWIQNIWEQKPQKNTVKRSLDSSVKTFGSPQKQTSKDSNENTPLTWVSWKKKLEIIALSPPPLLQVNSWKEARYHHMQAQKLNWRHIFSSITGHFFLNQMSVSEKSLFIELFYVQYSQFFMIS